VCASFAIGAATALIALPAFNKQTCFEARRRVCTLLLERDFTLPLRSLQSITAKFL